MNCTYCNTGKLDRIARVVVGLILIALAVITKHAFLYIGLIPLFTGLFGFCPLYTIMKINTCKIGGCKCHSKVDEEKKEEISNMKE